METVKFLGGFLVLIVLSLIGGYFIWHLKGKKTNLAQETNKAFDFFNYRYIPYLLIVVIIIFLVLMLISNL